MNLEAIEKYRSEKLAGRPATTMAKLDEKDVQDLIFERIAGGTEIKRVCSELGISHETFYVKMARSEEFRTLCDRARESQQEAMMDQNVDISDDADETNWKTQQLRIHARQWRIEKLSKKYAKSQAASVNVQINIPSGMAEAMQLATSLPVIDAELDKS